MAPLPGSVCFYSNSTLNKMKQVPQASRQLEEQLCQHQGVELSSRHGVTLTSSSWAMFGGPAAAAEKASAAWLAGTHPLCMWHCLLLLDDRDTGFCCFAKQHQ